MASGPFREQYERLLAGEHPWDADDAAPTRTSDKANAAPRARFMHDLFALNVEHDVVQALFRDLDPVDLLDDRFARRRDNITGLWKEALRCWDESGHEEARSCHAVETLLALAHALLPKPYTNYTLDVVTLLAGRMADADDVFYTLVAAMDDTLRRTVPRSTPWQQRRFHATLRLALVVAACVGPSSLATYLLHRDLFAAAMSVVQRYTAADVLCEASLLTALLATAGQSHGATHASQSDPMLCNVGIQPYQCRARAYAASPDVARMVQAWSLQARRIMEAYQATAKAPGPGPSHTAWPWSWLSAPVPASAPAPCTALPPPSMAFLFAVWLWLQVSDTVAFTMFASSNAEPFIVPFFSMASYLLTHAASSARATTYAHTALQCMLALLGPTDSLQLSHVQVQLFTDAQASLLERVEMCRDRADTLPSSPTRGTERPRPLVVLVLDQVVLFLKYNRRKRLDVAAFRSALACVQRTLLLCAQHQVRVDYDWLSLWRAILATVTFVAARQADLPDDVAPLAQALLDTLALALVLSDQVLPTPGDTHWLIYELARTRAPLEQLDALAGVARQASWDLLDQVLQAVDTRLAQERDSSSSFSFLRFTSSSAPVSMTTVLHAIQALALDTLLAPDKPSCRAIVRSAQTSTSRGLARLSSPSAALVRAVQQDVLAAPLS
ncbi:hypothetical protein MNAN1_001748 [Malassezia nana]|uniref:Armadillo-like helical domain-containing protein n=1 Tax=Malassezia nana TaxID=180528 RepID=A0AAF0EQ70_9BASI|nr:hypothetical protein MNAN1_001748 [Malassezia nana]